jgi:hypothetical protein
VKPGDEFETSQDSIYEKRGMAVPVGVVAGGEPTKRKQNKAAEAGPLASPGGRTGETVQPLLSRQVQAPKTRRSSKPADERE